MATQTGVITINGIKIIECDVSPALDGGLVASIGSFASAKNGAGLFYKNNSGNNDWINVAYNVLEEWEQEKFVIITSATILGQVIQLTPSVAAGGTVNVSPTNLYTPDINSVINKSRQGVLTIAVTTAISSRAQAVTPNIINFIMNTDSVFGFGGDVAFNGGQIDFSVDLLYLCNVNKRQCGLCRKRKLV